MCGRRGIFGMQWGRVEHKEWQGRGRWGGQSADNCGNRGGIVGCTAIRDAGWSVVFVTGLKSVVSVVSMDGGSVVSVMAVRIVGADRVVASPLQW